MENEILTVAEAAGLLKVSAEVVTELLDASELPGRIVGGEWRTTTRALVSFVDGVPLQGAVCCTTEEGQMVCTPAPGGGACC